MNLGIPLSKGYNGKLTSEQAGKIGGPIGGNMVKEMVRMAQEQMMKSSENSTCPGTHWTACLICWTLSTFT